MSLYHDCVPEDGVMSDLERKIVVWHGEGPSLFYVVEYLVSNPDIWEVLKTFTNNTSAELWLEEIEERDNG